MRLFGTKNARYALSALGLAGILTTTLFANSVALAAGHSPQSLYDDVWKLINVRFVDSAKNGQDWRIWRHRYDKSLQTDDDAYVAIETMLASLNDRYTRFLNPDDFAEEGRSIKATLFGIGIQIGNRDNKLLIIAPMEDTPADKAGLKAEDEILKIDDTQAKGMSVKEAADLIRGEKGSKVKLLIRRANKDAKDGYTDQWFAVMRDEIKIKSVSFNPPLETKVPSNMGYIKISTFLSSNTASEVKEALKNSPDKQGFIIDLRSNPGGLLSNAVTISDYFLDDSAIVSTVDRDGYKEVRRTEAKDLTDKPLVVLIDKGSASASEILSGALRDNNRAILVGKTSFGKGLVQEINRLPGGAGINVTTQKYLTPNDTDIDKTGIVPDIVVDLTEADIKAKVDKQLESAISVLKDSISGHSVQYLQSRSLLKKGV